MLIPFLCLMKRLLFANAALLVVLVLHSLDHVVNQPPRELAPEVTVTGFVGLAASIATIILVLRWSPSAIPASIAVGFGNIVGFAGVHLVPRWSAFSDPYSTFEPNALTWLLVAAPMAAALYLGLEALRALRVAPEQG